MIIILFLMIMRMMSIRWLMSVGRTKKTVRILRRIAKINNKDVPEDVFQRVEKLCEEQSHKK